MIRNTALLTAACVALAITGCGKSEPKKTATAHASSDAKVIAIQNFGEGDTAEEVKALCLTEHGLFVGTRKRLHAVKFDAKSGAFAPAEIALEEAALKKYEVNAIRLDNKRVLVATTDGLAIHDGKGWSSESIGPVNDVVPYASTLWLARSRGLEKKQGDDWREEKIPGLGINTTSASRISSLAATPDGKLWIGSEFGIYHFDAKEKKWGKQLYGDYLNVQGDMVMPEPGNVKLCGNVVRRLEQDAAGNLLICTETGLSIFDGKEDWKTFQGDYETHTAETGLKSRVKKKGNVDLPSPSISSALLLGNVLWIGTAEGLVRIDGDKLTLFDTAARLPSSAVTALCYDAANQTLYVGTDKGLAALAPVAAPAPAASPNK